MPIRAKAFIGCILVGGLVAAVWSMHAPSAAWLSFFAYLALTLASSTLKVPLPGGSGTMSLNYPFIFLAILQLSPGQVCLLTVLSIAAQCRIRVAKVFTFVQIAFNLAAGALSAAVTYLCCAWLRSHGLSAGLALAMAAVVYFFASTLPVAMVIGLSQHANWLGIWSKQFRWFLPFYIVGAVLAAGTNFVSQRFGWASAVLVLPVLYTVYRSYLAQVRSLRERQRHLEETEALHLRTIEGLAMAIEAKDQNTHEHLFRVRDYVTEIATVMKLDELQKKALLTAAFLHDIGKLAVPEHIINKPGKLTAEEFETMKIHPVVGADILERVRFPYPVVPIVRSHHERWDGKGYPDGLKGEQIPIGARILSAVDCFDALASDRPYRKAMPVEKAMAIVREMSGSQFDPEVVAILEHHLATAGTAVTRPGTFVALDLNVDVSRGEGPAAGLALETAEAAANTKQADTEDNGNASHASVEAVALIAAARGEAQALFERSGTVGTSLSLGETVAVMASCLRSLFAFDCCAVYLRDRDVLSEQYFSGDSARCFTHVPISLGDGISGWVAQSGRPILNGNAAVEKTYKEIPGSVLRLHSALAVPLVDLQDGILGVLTLYSAQENYFQRDHLRILQAAEAKFSLALQNAMRFRGDPSDASIDFLTGLLNSRGLFQRLEDRLQECRASQARLALVVCDLDGLEAVNDQEGHLIGNRLLTHFGRQLQTYARVCNTVARIGGNEFALLLPVANASHGPDSLGWLVDALGAAGRQAGVESCVSMSTGAAYFPGDGDAPETLLAVAERRMYRGKCQPQRSVAVMVGAADPQVALVA